MKIICMIPARLGSKRVPHKNLRLLAGKPLVAHVVEKAKESGMFHEIYINSESDLFQKLADEYRVRFYKRPEELASDEALNDDFVHDFIKEHDCDVIVQINPTNPLITIDDIRAVVGMSKYYDTVHSIKKAQIELMFNGKPINFDYLQKMPRSQELTPAVLFCSGIMAWKVGPYMRNMARHHCATYGCGENVGYYELKGFATVDIDHEEDFQLAEAILSMKEVEKKYYA